MRVPEAFALQLVLLVLAVFGSSKANHTSDTSTPSINTTQKSPQSSSHTGWKQSTAGLPSTIQSVGQAEKIPNLIFLNDNITISGFPKVSVTKTISIRNPTELELLCSLVISDATEMEIMEAAWKFRNQTIKEETIRRNETQKKWCTRNLVKAINKDQLGNYMCVFKTKPEINATFILQVPKIHVKSEHITSYVGDSVILTCEVGSEKIHSDPIFWTWHINNGSEEVVINSTLLPKKYNIIQTHPNMTKLKIFDLSELDSNFYWCKAGFPLSDSEGKVSLKVLTFLTPLKPFLVIAAEVVILVALIFIYEVCSKKKEENAEAEKEFEQSETLKSEDSNGVENCTTRHRKV